MVVIIGGRSSETFSIKHTFSAFFGLEDNSSRALIVVSMTLSKI
jgi:hypothetical protein